MKIIKKKLKIAIDSPAAAGAGTLAKKISDHYNLYYLDTGKIYRYIAYLKIKYPKKFGNSFVKKQIKIKSTPMIEKTTDIVNEFPKNKINEISKIEKIAKKSIIYNRR